MSPIDLGKNPVSRRSLGALEVVGFRNRVFIKVIGVTDGFGKKPGFLAESRDSGVVGFRNRVFIKVIRWLSEVETP